MKKKSKKLPKVILLALVLLLTGVAGLLGYYSLAFDETSEKLISAKQALSVGDKNKAYKIYFSIIEKDTSCEEAYRALASLAEERVNYKDSAYFWMMVSNLNPMDAKAKANYFRAMIISGVNNTLEFRYERLADKSLLNDEILYYIAKVYIRNNQEVKLSALIESVKNAEFKTLIRAWANIYSEQYADSQNDFEKLAKSQNKTVKETALMGLAMCYFVAEKTKLAQEVLSQIKSENTMLLGDKYLLEAAIAESLTDIPTAIEKYYKLAQLRRYHLSPIVKCAEIAYQTKNLQALGNLKRLIEARDKVSLEMFYYISSLESFAGGNYKKALENLAGAGQFAESIYGRILELKCYDKLKQSTDYTKLALIISQNINSIPDFEYAEIVRILKQALNANRKDKTLLASLLKIAPENAFANMINMETAFAEKNFFEASNSAKVVLNTMGYSPSAFSIFCASEMNAKHYRNVIDIASKRLKTNPNDTLAMLFSARANLKTGDINLAKNFYLSALKSAPNNISLACEAGVFFNQNKFFKELIETIAVVEAVDSPDNKVLAFLLKAEYAKKCNKPKEQISLLKKAIGVSGESDSLYLELVRTYRNQGLLKDAIALLENRLEQANSFALRLNLAVLLREDGKLAESIKMLTTLASENPNSAEVIIELSKVKQQAGLNVEAMQDARNAVNLAPENFDALYNLGHIFLLNKYYENASVFLERAYFKTNAEDVKKLYIESLVGLANLPNTTPDRKLFIFRKVLSLSPENDTIKKEIHKLENANP